MDIFTTQLTRVVQVPIKPVSLKVKALLKDAATPKLKEDHDHLENHDNYFEKSEKEKEEQSSKKRDTSTTQSVNEMAEQENKDETKQKNKTTGKDKHLDLYA